LQLEFLRSCFLNINNNNNIKILIKLTEFGKINGFIQIYKLNKEKIKEIKNNNVKDVTSFLDTYYNMNTSYLILCNRKEIINVYNYNKNKWTIFRTKNENTEESINQFIIINNNNSLKMIGSSFTGIYLWNFQTGNLLCTIKGGSGRNPFFELWLWNNDRFFIGQDEILNFVKIRNDKLNVVKRFSEHKENIPCIKR